MARPYPVEHPTVPQPYETVVGVAGTPVGSDTAFQKDASYLSVIADKDIWAAVSSAKVTTPATGVEGERVFVAANERRVLPWLSRGFWVVNSVGGELPKVRAEGWL